MNRRYINDENLVGIQFHCKYNETFCLDPFLMMKDECPYIEGRISLQVTWKTTLALGTDHDHL